MRGKKSAIIVVTGRLNSKGRDLGSRFDKAGLEFLLGKPKEVMPQPKPKHKRHNKGLRCVGKPGRRRHSVCQ